MASRRSRRVAARLLAVVVIIAGCSNNPGEPGATSTTVVEPIPDTTAPPDPTPETTTGPDPVTETTSLPPVETDPGVQVLVTVSEGVVIGGAERISVPLGSSLTLRVTADVTDEVHVHGYDLSTELSPTIPAEIIFDTDIPGVFEIELEDVGLVLARLEVS